MKATGHAAAIEYPSEARDGATPRSSPSRPLELSVVIPTLNEVDNVSEVVRRLGAVLSGIQWEVIFVDDDSRDGTAEALHQIARIDSRVRCLRRLGRRGLSSACVEGMLSSPAPYIAVMDADLQHDEHLLPRMLEALKESDIDIVVGSRYVSGGGTGGWAGSRLSMSRLATRMSRLVLRGNLQDPMSGFFMIAREPMHRAIRNVSGIGFKILLDMFASSPAPLRYRELPYQFGLRLSGKSKLDASVSWEYGLMLLDKLFGRFVPVRFVAFGLVGAAGVVVHVAVLYLSFVVFGNTFVAGQSLGAVAAMTSNFVLNNTLTYRDKRLRGRRMLYGWFSFVLACSIGALANVAVADYLFGRGVHWLSSALVGIVIGAVWNYAVTGRYTWKSTARP